MMGRLSTPNVLEVSYLLERRHRILEVQTRTSWPYGILELCVTMEGDGIELDHGSFLRYGTVGPLTDLKTCFESVMEVVERQAEGGWS